MSDLEFRPYTEAVEVRSAEGGRLVLSGTAIRYGARSRDLGGFRERIMSGAATEAIQKGDVLALEEHRSERYMGRTGNGTLRLIETPTELRYEVDLLDDAIGREVAAKAERKDYGGSSFGFRALPASVKWTKDDDGTPLRSIHGFSVMRDVGPTVAPAYPASTAETVLRNFSAEAERDVEFRSVMDAAQRGELALLLDGVLPIEQPSAESLVIQRRPAHWFV